MTAAARMPISCGYLADPSRRWPAMLAVFAMVVGLAHVWLHDSGTLDSGHFDKSVAEDCLLSKMPLVAAVAASTKPCSIVLLVILAPTIAVSLGRAYWRPHTRAPPLS